MTVDKPDATGPLTAQAETDIRRYVEHSGDHSNHVNERCAFCDVTRLLAALDAARAESAALRARVEELERESEAAAATFDDECAAHQEVLAENARLRNALADSRESVAKLDACILRVQAGLGLPAGSTDSFGMARRAEQLRDALATVERERDEYLAEADVLLWNLAGCDVIAGGGQTDFNETNARPALFTVRRMRADLDARDAAGRMVVAALTHLRDRLDPRVRIGEVEAALAHVATTVPGWKET